MTAHTPLPWHLTSGAIEDQRQIPIARMDRDPGNGTTPVERDENAAFIVRAVNAHQELVAIIERFTEITEHRWRALPLDTPEKEVIGKAKQALSKAGKE